MNINTFFEKHNSYVILAYTNNTKNTIKIFKTMYELFKYSVSKYGNEHITNNLINDGIKVGDYAVITHKSVCEYYSEDGNPYSCKGFYLAIPSML